MRFLLTSLMIGFATTIHAASPIDGIYASVFGGYTYLPSNVNRTINNLNFSNAVYQGGYDAGGNIGYKSNPMRYEGEFTYLRVAPRKYRVNGIQQTSVSGYSDAYIAMANIYYDFPNLLNALQPYIGGGIGYSWFDASLNSKGPTFNTRFTGSNCKFAYQGAAGVTYNFAENFALTLGYRYVATLHSENLGRIFQAHMANGGVVYRFDEGRYK